MIFIPIGFGHGFLSLEENSIMIYKTSCAYSPENDFGIHWNSIDFNWNIESPIVSERDNQFTSLINFQSPLSIMNIFVTGGTGFIGSHFLQYALAKGHNIVAITRRKSHSKEPFNKKIKWLEKDFDNVSKDDFSDIDALVHLASSGVTPQPASWEDCLTLT